jgi:hypothetical protein
LDIKLINTQPPRSVNQLPFPIVCDPEAPPIRRERHGENSIATVRRRDGESWQLSSPKRRHAVHAAKR